MTSALAVAAHSQDAQSLRDRARQARLEKRQKEAEGEGCLAKDASSKHAPGTDAPAKDAQPPKVPHIIRNDEIPSRLGSTLTPTPSSQAANAAVAQPSCGNGKAAAEQWKASLENEIGSLSESIRYAGANCVPNSVRWNERQKQKQNQVESMKAKLEQQHKSLEDFEEAARKQGFGSAVYDP
jgi:predicted ribosome quality control (RQC) complex YloA/Tae2 family protein